MPYLIANSIPLFISQHFLYSINKTAEITTKMMMQLIYIVGNTRQNTLIIVSLLEVHWSLLLHYNFLQFLVYIFAWDRK